MGIHDLIGKTKIADLPEDDGGGFEPAPHGEYRAESLDAEIKPWGKGHALSIECQITGPACAGKKFWHNITLSHPNETTAEIGTQQLRTFCIAALGLSMEDKLPDDPLNYVGYEFNVGLKIDAWTNDDGETKRNNKVRYVAAPDEAPKGPSEGDPKAKKKSFDDDDIPF